MIYSRYQCSRTVYIYVVVVVFEWTTNVIVSENDVALWPRQPEFSTFTPLPYSLAMGTVYIPHK